MMRPLAWGLVVLMGCGGDPETPDGDGKELAVREWDPVRQRWPVVADVRAVAAYQGEVVVGGEGLFGVVGEGGIEALTYALMDTPAILDQWCELQLANHREAMRLRFDSMPKPPMKGFYLKVVILRCLSGPSILLYASIQACVKATILAVNTIHFWPK